MKKSNRKYDWLFGLALLLMSTACACTPAQDRSQSDAREQQSTMNELREPLNESATSMGERNQALMADLRAQVATGSQEGEWLDEIERSGAQARLLLGKCSSDLEAIAGLDPVTGEMLNMKETEKNFAYWMGKDPSKNGNRGTGEAMQLKRGLNDYCDFANLMVCKIDGPGCLIDSLTLFPPLAVDPPKDTWEYHTFYGKPVVADLALMEKYKLDVADIEHNLLETLQSLVGKNKK